MPVLNHVVQRRIHHYETDQLQSQLEDLRSENQRLRGWLEQLEDLISDATPILWVYGAPSSKRALETASTWELRAQETLQALEIGGL